MESWVDGAIEQHLKFLLSPEYLEKSYSYWKMLKDEGQVGLIEDAMLGEVIGKVTSYLTIRVTYETDRVLSSLELEDFRYMINNWMMFIKMKIYEIADR